MAEAMNPVNWFEIPVVNMSRAVKFYEEFTGLKLSLNTMGSTEMAWFPMNEGVPGSTGSLVKDKEYSPSHAGSLVYFTVADIDATLKKITAHGGKVLKPKMSIGEYGWVAAFEDSEGNRVALHQAL